MTCINSIIELVTDNAELFGGLAALVAVLGAIAAGCLTIWRPILRAFAGWRLARRMRSDQRQTQRAETIANMRSELDKVSDYFDRAYRIAEGIKSDLGSAGITHFPLKRLEELGDFPASKFLIGYSEEEIVLGPKTKALLDNNRMAWGVWSGILGEISKRKVDQRIPLPCWRNL